VSAVLERMTVFVNATYRDEDGFGLEALGAGLVEASWAGVPTVAPRQGGTVEAVVDGVTGTLVPEADPAALAEAAARYLRDPELAARTGEAGRAFARERYRPDSAAGRLWTALRAIAEGGGAAPTMPARLG
jgi:glycosyltransferase involved in cell wall biosynthesis